jgi:hypothetical protein
MYLEPGESGIAVLSVTIPKGAKGGEQDIITIAAYGQDPPLGVIENAVEGQVDNVRAEDSTTALATVEKVYGVDVEILPCQSQTGTPGSGLVWIVRVTNTGNMDDNFNLTMLENPRDNMGRTDNWNPTLDDLKLEVPAGGVGSTYLRARIPENAKTATWNTFTVWATSEGDNQIYDSDTCDAYVLKQSPRVPNAWIKLTVETEIVAIELFEPTTWDFGLLDEAQEKATDNNYFTFRNVGNVPIHVKITGSDARSRPGEPVATWYLSYDGLIGLDTYVMWVLRPTEPENLLTKDGVRLWENMEAGTEESFGLRIRAPSAISVPSKMWTIVTLTAVRA